MDILVSTSYLAPVSYFSALNAASTAFVEHQEHYVKQTFRNRCVIAGPDGPLPLTVPVVKPQDPHCMSLTANIWWIITAICFNVSVD